MSPPLPVPSKAAIHALRGIVLGTSCAIGVIIEDRRRRISTLRTALENKEKLKKSSRYYHGAVDPARLLIDEQLLIDNDPYWQKRQQQSRKDSPELRATSPDLNAENSRTGRVRGSAEPDGPHEAKNERLPESQPAIVTESPSSPPATSPTISAQDSIHGQVPFPPPRIRPPAFESVRPWQTSQHGPPRVVPKTPKQWFDEFSRLLDSEDEEKLGRATALFHEVSRTCSFRREMDEWLALSAYLCQECQANNRWEDARSILDAVVGRGALEEDQYYAHDPIPLIDHILSQPVLATPSSAELLSMASRIFFATFKGSPQSHAAEVERVGRGIMTRALAMHRYKLAHNAYWRVLCILDDAASFTGWAIRQLFAHGDHKNVIKFFTLNFSKMQPDEECFSWTLNCVAKSVAAMDGYKAEAVCQAYTRMCCPWPFMARWLMIPLRAHWDRHRNFTAVKAVFDELVSSGLVDQLQPSPGIVYRMMYEFAVLAGQEVEAQKYQDEILQKYPHMSSDVQLMGVQALSRARAGDWEGVSQILNTMPHRIRRQREHTLIAVVKEYGKTHPAQDVRDFATNGARTLGLRMHRYLITLVANKFGDCHDMDGFMSWLQDCSRAGYTFDPSFCNSALQNCRSKWNFSYDDLRKLNTRMHELGTASDEVTRRIMSQAAVKERRLRKTYIGRYGPRSKIISVNRLAYNGRSTDVRDVYEAMNQELASGRHTVAINTYKRAIQHGMRACSHCLRLAVTATLQRPNGKARTDQAMSLIHSAHLKGGDVSFAVSILIRHQIDEFEGRPEDVVIHMRNLTNRFETLHIVIEPAVLSQMGLTCVRIGRHSTAIALCNLAKDKSNTTNLCCSITNFKALLMAYSQTMDLDGIHILVGDLFKSKFSADKTVLSHLRATRRRLEKLDQSAIVSSILQVIDDTITKISQLRSRRQMEGRTISAETLQIMSEALAEMQSQETPPADKFNEEARTQESIVSTSERVPLAAVG
ncbi:hypothetical protein F4780DRAFT_310341 [Xylariomycetidae sp. FL0641]|nr:hypothetical protein F4780DRAFT_310341 [Xylariomycetidae sp. FL0641]